MKHVQPPPLPSPAGSGILGNDKAAKVLVEALASGCVRPRDEPVGQDLLAARTDLCDGQGRAVLLCLA